MRVLIVEDEMIAAERLKTMILEVESSFEIVEILDSVSTSVEWLSANETPDLIFLDIQLADGLSFKIFEKVETEAPIIFTTAYDQYAIRAFKLNSLDYLLKPIGKEDLAKAIAKFKKSNSSKNSSTTNSIDTNQLLDLIGTINRSYKERFIVKIGEHIKTVLVSEIRLFYSQDKAIYAITKEGKKYIIDYTMDEIESAVDSLAFFRVSRKYLVSLEGIADILTYSNSRLKLTVQDAPDLQDVIVAREKVSKFKTWLDR